MGTSDSPGPTIVTITGDVQQAVVAEIDLGQSLGSIIAGLADGPRPGRLIKAVLSGVSNPVLTADQLGTPITHESLAAAGGGLGSAGFIVYDDTRNMVDVAYQVSKFLHVESCGQCNPCKTGTHDITAALEHLVTATGSPRDAMATIERRLLTVTDASRCYLPTQEQRVIASLPPVIPRGPPSPSPRRCRRPRCLSAEADRHRRRRRPPRPQGAPQAPGLDLLRDTRAPHWSMTVSASLPPDEHTLAQETTTEPDDSVERGLTPMLYVAAAVGARRAARRKHGGTHRRRTRSRTTTHRREPVMTRRSPSFPDTRRSAGMTK